MIQEEVLYIMVILKRLYHCFQVCITAQVYSNALKISDVTVS